jgi:hypothetical protein
MVADDARGLIDALLSPVERDVPRRDLGSTCDAIRAGPKALSHRISDGERRATGISGPITAADPDPAKAPPLPEFAILSRESGGRSDEEVRVEDFGASGFAIRIGADLDLAA